MEVKDIGRLIHRAIVKVKLPFQAVSKASKLSKNAFLYSLSNGVSAEDREEIENLQHYGLISRLPAGTRVVVIPRGGKAENLVIVSEEHKTAISLSEGDVALERETGEYVWLKDGEIEVKADLVTVNCADTVVNCSKNAEINATENVDVNAKNVNVTATVLASVAAPNVTVTAAVQATITAATVLLTGIVNLGGVSGLKALVTEVFFTLYNAHIHPGVMSGGGTTGAPIVPASGEKTINTKAI